MKLMFTSANFRVIPPLSPLRPTRAGLGMSVTRLLAASLLLQGVAIGQGQKVAVTVSPASVSLTTSQSQQFTAAVTGNSTSGVTWSVSPALGTISRTGLYTAPASVWSVQIVTVTATTVGSPSKSGSASVSLAPPVSLSISPATSTLSVSQNQQFTAAVTGTTNTGVIWSVSPAVGTVSSAGLYTAPASVSRLQSVIVSATSTANPAQAASATVMLQPPLTISTGALADGNAGSGYIQTLAASGGAPPYSWTISSGSLPPGLSLVDSTISGTPTIAGSYPMSIQVKDNSGLQVSKSLNLVVAAALLITTATLPNCIVGVAYSAPVTASGGAAPYTWSLASGQLPPGIGLSPSGTLSGSPLSPGSYSFGIQAADSSGQKVTRSYTAAIAPAVVVSLSPTGVNLTASRITQFTALVVGGFTGKVTWSLTPSIGTLSSDGLYTAPATISSVQTVSVVATSIEDPAQSARASVTLNPTITVSVSPGGTLTASQTQQFTASVSGSTNTSVTWSLAPAVGSISTSGLYTAPSSVPGPQTVTVTATSSADPTKSASASIALIPSVTVSVTPLTVSLAASQISQFTATVSGTSNTTVTWSVSPAVGTVSSTGLYTAPGSISSAQTVTVTAISAADSTKSASANVTLTSPITVLVTPSTASLVASETTQFTATVSGSSNTAVTWSVSPPVGTISSTGLYTAPPSISSAQTITVTSTALADPTKSASAGVTLNPPANSVSVSLTPNSASMRPSQTAQLTASVTGTTNTGVTWSTPSVGNLVTNGSTGVYISPSIIDVSQTVEVDAISMADSTKVARALISLMPAVLISVMPGSATLTDGQTQQFTADVSGTSNTAVTWSLNPAIGSISSSGRYTPPPTLLADQAVAVKATLQSDGSKAATAQLNLRARPSLTFTLNDNGLDTLVWDGVNYNYKYGEGLLTSVNLRLANGSTSFTYAPPCVRSLSGNTVTQRCSVDGTSMTAAATFSLAGVDTVCANLAISNQSPSVPMDGATFSVLGFTSPNYDSTTSRFWDVGRGNPVSMVNFGAGRWALWIDDPNRDSSIPMWVGYQYNFKNQPTIYQVAPGQTKTMRACMRITNDMMSSLKDLVPEAYDHYRAAYPPVINWPDRRPIMSWFVAEGTKRSVTNPRGYFQDALIDVSDVPAFRNRAIQLATQIRDEMNARPVRPQGIILWDIEGQEFDHPTTYIGDPTAFAAGYAPEMHAAADDVFAVFKNAGYRVGVTIRPQHLNFGPTLPATCHYDPDNSFKDYFIQTGVSLGNSFHGCYDPAGLSWLVIPNGNGSQTNFSNSTANIPAVTDLLRSKIAYAKSRWNATLFYVDSAVWEGGTPLPADVFRQLQQEFPDVLFIPEQETLDTLSAGIPFTDPKNPGDARFSPLSWRWVYPEGAMGMRLTDCLGTCWTENADAFKIGLKVGDIALYNIPRQMSATQLTTVESLIEQAKLENSSVFVTDLSTGRQLNFSGPAGSVLPYPVKLRVYFSDSVANLTGSSTYCAAGQLLGGNACTLDLSGMNYSEVRYYDYTNRLVGRLAATPIP